MSPEFEPHARPFDSDVGKANRPNGQAAKPQIMRLHSGWSTPAASVYEPGKAAEARHMCGSEGVLAQRLPAQRRTSLAPCGSIKVPLTQPTEVSTQPFPGGEAMRGAKLTAVFERTVAFRSPRTSTTPSSLARASRARARTGGQDSRGLRARPAPVSDLAQGCAGPCALSRGTCSPRCQALPRLHGGEAPGRVCEPVSGP